LDKNPKNIIQIGHSFKEKIDDLTNKILCVTCGGKGVYLLIEYGQTKGELVSCEKCEKGFRYEKILKNHGKSA